MRFYKIEITKIPCEKRRKEYYEEKSNCNHLNRNDGRRNACRMCISDSSGNIGMYVESYESEAMKLPAIVLNYGKLQNKDIIHM